MLVEPWLAKYQEMQELYGTRVRDYGIWEDTYKVRDKI